MFLFTELILSCRLIFVKIKDMDDFLLHLKFYHFFFFGAE